MKSDAEVLEEMRLDVYLGALGEGGTHKCVRLLERLPIIGEPNVLYLVRDEEGFANPRVWENNEYIPVDFPTDLSAFARISYVDSKARELKALIEGKADKVHTHHVADIVDFPNIPSVEGLLSKTEANNLYQQKGEYLTPQDISHLQPKHDVTLETTAKDVVPAINEIKGMIDDYDVSGKQDKNDANINVKNGDTTITNVVEALNYLDESTIKKINVGAFSSMAFAGGAQIGNATKDGWCRLCEWRVTNLAKSYTTFEVCQIDGTGNFYLTEFTLTTRQNRSNNGTMIYVNYFHINKTTTTDSKFSDVIKVCFASENSDYANITLFGKVYQSNSLYTFIKRKGPDWSVEGGYRIIPTLGTRVQPTFLDLSQVYEQYDVNSFIEESHIM